MRLFPIRLKSALRPTYHALREKWRKSRLRGPRLVAALAHRLPNATFVQVGSNDGQKHDPLHRAIATSRWSGVMVEPVPYVFKRLRKHYGDNPRIRLENVAVAAQAGTLPFYHVPQATADEQLPSWYDELGSFRKEVVLKHADRIPNLEQRLACIEVPCVTFAGLCVRSGITTPDLIHTDTEGYDFEILKTIDFKTLRPLVLIYEHKHFDPATRAACHELVSNAGYESFEEGADTWCMNTRVRSEPHRLLLNDWRHIHG